VPSDRHERVADARDPALVRAEAAIAESRRQMALSITELNREIARAVDWREWFRRKPVLALGLAFGLGVLLGRRH
jgi:hypothetical protein